MLDRSYDISKSKILYAMENTKSNKAAARFLNISYNTYRKYARRYKDEETGETLFSIHKNQAGKNIPKGSVHQKGYYKLRDILAGKHPDYDPKRLKQRIIKENILEECCHRCGFEERRVFDYSMPLMLNWIDGDVTNHRRDNLEFLCYNCYYLTVDNIAGKKLIIDF